MRQISLLLIIGWARIVTANQSGHGVADTPFPEQGEYSLQARQLVQRVVARNAETLSARLQADIAEYLHLAARGIYEPVTFAEWSYVDNQRPRTAEERNASYVTANTTTLDETDNNLALGMRGRVASGGEVEIRHRFLKTTSNLISASSSDNHDVEYTGLLTLSFKQPLLRDSGRAIIETDLQVAALERDVTLVQYQQQVLKIAGDAVNAYWQLYQAREVQHLRQTALAHAQQIAADVKLLVERGRSPQMELLETQIAIANRAAEVALATQSLVDAEAKIKTLLNLPGDSYANLNFTAAQAPIIQPDHHLSFTERYTRALTTWPLYRIAMLHQQQQVLRLKYTNNQRLPQLDLLLGYNLNSLNHRAPEAWHDSFSRYYPGWSVALNLEAPIFGNQRARHEFFAQQLRVSQAELEIDAVRQRLSNDLRVRTEQLQQSGDEVTQWGQHLRLREELLERVRFDYQLGRARLRDLLDREDQLNEARQRYVESSVRLELARIALLLADGSLLAEYGIAVTP